MVAKRSESLSMILHIGSFATKEVEDDIRMTLRAAMSLERRRLKRATVKTKERRVTIQGKGITVSMYGEGWIHLVTEVDPPLSAERLLTANQYNNAIASHFNNLFVGKAKVSVTTTITEEMPAEAINLSRFCLPEALNNVSKAVGYNMAPRGIWLISSEGEHGEKHSIIITSYKKNCEVDFAYFTSRRGGIPNDILMETHKKLRETIRNSLPIIRAD